MIDNSAVLFNTDLNLQLKHASRVKTCFDIIDSLLPQSEIYLFGSYAKRKIKDESDIDLLVLVDDHYTSKELQEIRWQIEDQIYKANNMTFEIDLKLYTKKFYESQMTDSYFIMEIEKYKKDLRGVKWS
ncbi:nucleotidyltransferase domain-containing protein [Cellulosilyticum sp. I15G10I2]|uniref:nucleotidyltransferase domain-containing protein n=1 Tax=Cellulosilyticum sp. I15G10I2 TaxID=1892843 RepID=UPI00085BE581|nr:nucleotidyltransferase domain-containing protein [Cellulosilyticum sp. I15G10I2]